MEKASGILQMFAYYLSKYDLEAVKALGCTSRSEAMHMISVAFYQENNYLKLRRDEYDVITGSHRKGWRNRKPTDTVLKYAAYYSRFSFEQLTEMAKGLLEGKEQINAIPTSEIQMLRNRFDESEIEDIINYKDDRADNRIHNAVIKERILNRQIITSLKQLYRNRCQICGRTTMDKYGVSIVEAHHIDPFSTSLNNDAINIMILCPNHHRLVHAAKATFDVETLTLHYANGYVEALNLNYHL